MESKKRLEALKTCVKEAVSLVKEVDDNVAATHPSVWTLCSRVEEINELLAQLEETLT